MDIYKKTFTAIPQTSGKSTRDHCGWETSPGVEKVAGLIVDVIEEKAVAAEAPAAAIAPTVVVVSTVMVVVEVVLVVVLVVE